MKNIHGGDIYQYNNILDFSANIKSAWGPESVNRSIADAIGKLVIIRKCTATVCEKPSGEVSYRQQSDYLRKWSGGCNLSVCVCGKTEENSGDGTLLCRI